MRAAVLSAGDRIREIIRLGREAREADADAKRMQAHDTAASWDAMDAADARWTDAVNAITEHLAALEAAGVTAVFLATRKAVYEKLHPETKADAFRGNQHTGKLASDIVSFATATAEKFGLSKRHVERLVAAGSKLAPNEVRQLRGAPRAVGLKDLMEIARIGDPVERYDVVDMLAAGRAKSAGEARRIRAQAAGGIVAPPKDPVQDAFNRLVEAWSRASMAAKRRFVAENFEELGALCAQEEEDRFEAEKPALLAEIAAMKADAGSAGE